MFVISCLHPSCVDLAARVGWSRTAAGRGGSARGSWGDSGGRGGAVGKSDCKTGEIPILLGHAATTAGENIGVTGACPVAVDRPVSIASQVITESVIQNGLEIG